MIKKCNGIKCKSKYQDEKYGKDMRVMNETQDKPVAYRCTVCEKERN